MPWVPCDRCGQDVAWSWREAFHKFGFNDGDAMMMTESVTAVLKAAGYETKAERWGLHNTIIVGITKDGPELIPPAAKVGHDDPRTYLPDELTTLQDAKFPDCIGECDPF